MDEQGKENLLLQNQNLIMNNEEEDTTDEIAQFMMKDKSATSMYLSSKNILGTLNREERGRSKHRLSLLPILNTKRGSIDDTFANVNTNKIKKFS